MESSLTVPLNSPLLHENLKYFSISYDNKKSVGYATSYQWATLFIACENSKFEKTPPFIVDAVSAATIKEKLEREGLDWDSVDGGWHLEDLPPVGCVTKGALEAFVKWHVGQGTLPEDWDEDDYSAFKALKERFGGK